MTGTQTLPWNTQCKTDYLTIMNVYIHINQTYDGAVMSLPFGSTLAWIEMFPNLKNNNNKKLICENNFICA